MIYFQLMFVFMRIGVFTFGGGYAMLPLIQREVVRNQEWITSSVLVDMIAISQMSPGPIAVNLATFIGYTQAGVLGGLLATFGVVSLTSVLVLVAARVLIKNPDHFLVKGFFKGIRPAVISFVMAAILSLYNVSVPDMKSSGIMIGAFLVFWKLKIHPVPIILCSGMIAVFIF
ncbi:chromate transporter [Tindallia magadiensis]|uniref:Chromate transporter n=1 Tax=Tindallia magadiensis TaxID=69895 RepID=A0A1I3B8V6_9FIRM|nr:chromate transporter [Tindallia magadiensis]SFH58506.1 chromate transporter [Tindallia magadiensis]